MGHYRGNSTRQHQIPIPHPHAILDSDRRVLVIRHYPRTTQSDAVIPVPDDGPMPSKGWHWTGKRFQKDPPK